MNPYGSSKIDLSNKAYLSHGMQNNLLQSGLIRSSQHINQQAQRNIDQGQLSNQFGNYSGLDDGQQPSSGVTSGTQNDMPEESGASAPVRKRISRACDLCNQSRRKCNGQNPCAHCIELNLKCEYRRKVKKRGKAPRGYDFQQAAAVADEPEATDKQSPDATMPAESRSDDRSLAIFSGDDAVDHPSLNFNDFQLGTDNRDQNMGEIIDKTMTGQVEIFGTRDMSRQSITALENELMIQDNVENRMNMDINYITAHGQSVSSNRHLSNDNLPSFDLSIDLARYADMTDVMQSLENYPANSQSPAVQIRNSPIHGFTMDTQSPNWTSMMSPLNQQSMGHLPSNSTLRYPVLQPLIPYLGSTVPLPLACDLLDLYFASSSSAQMYPLSPFVLGYVFRKKSFLHPSKPRRCTPALLASMLWVAAQTSDAAFLTASPSARRKVSQRLLDLTIGLQKPLTYGPPAGNTSFKHGDPLISGGSFGGLDGSMPQNGRAESSNAEDGAIGAGGLDHVATYIHLATVVSAGEYKGTSLRWWNAAWSLARELKLGQELPPNSSSSLNDLNGPQSPSMMQENVTEEEREERRRVWWLIYAIDRHLSLCYNKPLFFLDTECDGLLQPIDDTLWQASEVYDYNSSTHITSPNGSLIIRTRGFNFECTGHGIFGYFLPLMRILGEIVDLKHAMNHPRLGAGLRSSREWKDQTEEITRQLEAYGESLEAFKKTRLSTLEQWRSLATRDSQQLPPLEGLSSSSTHSLHPISSRMANESDIQIQTVGAYGAYIMHVLHILLTGKWDPVSLLEDTDSWISSQAFINAIGHAISATEAIELILENDPGLEFMPFFIGIYLLQGSFLLLLIADKLQSEASPSVVKACETIVRAHEACVATLNTEYQRRFRKVMRSALAQVRGRVPGDAAEQQLRRREILALYRWTGDGTGLAL